MRLIDKSGLKVLTDGCGTAPEPDILAVRGVRGAFQRGVDAIGHEMERRAPLHGDRWPGMMGEDKDRCVIRRVGAPPSLPGLIEPRPSDRPEHVSAQDPCADVGQSSGREVVIDPRRAALGPEHRPERPRGERPLVQGHAPDALRVLKTLAGTGAVAVEGDGKRMNAEFWHGLVPSFGQAYCTLK